MHCNDYIVPNPQIKMLGEKNLEQAWNLQDMTENGIVKKWCYTNITK